MQQIRLWEITEGRQLVEIQSDPVPLEKSLEDWLESDISVLDDDLLVIGRQVETDLRGTIDLLCLHSSGDTVVVELKKEKTPREVTAQALDYASCVKDFSYDRLVQIADSYFKNPDSLAAKFRERFEVELPSASDLNQAQRCIIVAETMDESTERIVGYLSDLNVPINMATVKHFKVGNDKKLLARSFLIDPEVTEGRARAASKSKGVTLASLQAEADENGIGELFRQMREGTRGVLLARPYEHRIWYGKRLPDGRQRLVLIVSSVPSTEGGGMSFRIHATRFNQFWCVNEKQLREWLPEGTSEGSVRGWVGSSPEERESAQGLEGTFKNVEEVEKFLAGLRTIRES